MYNHRKSTVMKILATALVILAIPVLVFFAAYWQKNQEVTHAQQLIIANKDFPVMQVADLAPYDGSDPAKPVYIGLNGMVYDVSAGRKFYQSDGPYHYLAGKDSSEALNQIGGDIIARKYPIIAKLAP